MLGTTVHLDLLTNRNQWASIVKECIFATIKEFGKFGSEWPDPLRFTGICLN